MKVCNRGSHLVQEQLPEEGTFELKHILVSSLLSVVVT